MLKDKVWVYVTKQVLLYVINLTNYYFLKESQTYKKWDKTKNPKQEWNSKLEA